MWPPKRGYYSVGMKGCTFVCVADFASLYPSIIISRNLDASTQIKGDKYDHLPHCVTPVGAKFVNKEVRKGILPRICEELLSNRSKAKREMALAQKAGDAPTEKLMNSRQIALKLVANSVYGVTGASNGKLPLYEIAESVTLTGREMIAYSVSIAEGPPFNAVVIYGDTDSIMFYFKDRPTKEVAFDRLDKVCAEVTAHFPKPVALQAEKLYENQILVNKKRYIGYLHARGAAPKVDAKGMESARRDNCPYLRDTMKALYQPLVVEGNVEKALKVVSDAAEALLSGRVPITKLFITKSITKLEYATPQVHMNVAMAMKRRDPSYTFDLSERIPYVIIENGSKKTCDKGEDPLWAIQHECRIDYRYYLERQLAPAISRVMSWVIGDRGLMEAVTAAEVEFSKVVFGKDEPMKALLKKRVDKALERLQDSTVEKLFGVKALAAIPRNVVATGGRMSGFFKVTKKCPACRVVYVEKGYCDECLENGRAAEDRKEHAAEYGRTMVEEQRLKDKCAKCRGYDSDEIKCVQRDCPTLYERAALQTKKGKIADLLF